MIRRKFLVSLILSASAAGAAHSQTVATPADTVAVLDTLYQTYERTISLPFTIGVRIPSYDRVNGLSLPWGPHIAVPGGRLDLDPTVTYRSNLGNFDPAIKAVARFGNSDQLNIYGGRGTYTNDAWIRSDVINTLVAFAVGTDARNYFRGDRVRADLSHNILRGAWNTRLWVGGNHEYDWSTGSPRPHTNAPWSVFGRSDTLKMRRVNPAIDRGHLTSGLAGVTATYEQAEIKGTIDVGVEHAFDEPTIDAHFTQLTIEARTKFPTFGTQSFAFKGHAVASSENTSLQRFVYLGGAGTLSTVDLFALGGDRLVYVQGEYTIPLVRPLLPFVGAPVLSAKYSAGSAGIRELPDFIQNIGAGIGLKIVKIEYSLDPNYKKTPYTHKSKFSLGFSLSL